MHYRVGVLLALLLSLPPVSGCANFYTYVSAAPAVSARVTPADRIVASELARSIAVKFDLHEIRYPPSSAKMPTESEATPDEMFTEFWNDHVWIQFHYAGDSAPFDFRIGELGAWGASERSRAIRDAIVEGIGRELPDFTTTITTRRDVLPFGP